jgi:hypothetical protein
MLGPSIEQIRSRLGHSAAAFMRDIYARVPDGMQEPAARAMSAMLTGQKEGRYSPGTLSGTKTCAKIDAGHRHAGPAS